MKPPKINLLKPGHEPPQKRRFSFWKKALIAVAAVVIAVPTLLSLSSIKLIQIASKLNPEQKQGRQVSLFEQVRRLISGSSRQLHGVERDRVNILVMGEGGEGHDGANLTDTMLFMSIQPSTDRVAMLSIPRDLWVDIPGQGQGKINSANALAEARKPGSGGEVAAQAVSQLLDQPVDYYIRVDFSAFKTLIDDVGGVTVNVDRAFTDYAYPTDDNLYKTVHFDKGWQTMNGDTALEYSRSRHGNNDEGSDFARSRRQQKILLALKDKIVSFDTLLNPSRVASILETLQTHVITDMELWEVVEVAKLARQMPSGSLIHYVLDDNPEGPLYATTMPLSNGDAYVLLPRRGDWSDVRKIAAGIFDGDARLADDAAPAPATPLRVEVRNGTSRPGLAQKTRDLLVKMGYVVTGIGNARDQKYDRTVIYDLTNGSQPEALSTLKSLLDADVSLTPSGYLSSGLTPKSVAFSNDAEARGDADFMIVIGDNYTN